MTPSPQHRLLVVDDEPDLRTLYELSLVREGYDVESAGSVAEAWALLQAKTFQAVITDMRLPDGTGLELLQRLDAAGRPERTVVITAYGSAQNAVDALKAGAYDYLTKPVDLRLFRSVIASALGRTPAGAQHPAAGAAARRDKPAAAPTRRALERLAGHSNAMHEVRNLVAKVSRSMAPVLVCGESGTGKELVARAIHDESPRGNQPFVAVNCGAIPEALLEAEFFGYRKGAFTGAVEDREGFFQAAQGGTLFLDEIGDLPLSMQSKLLRAIQERAVRPVGAVAEVHANVRVLSATHKDLAQEVNAGRFRQDLFYRLNVIQIMVPPLRERLDDLSDLCAAVLRRVAAEGQMDAVPSIDDTALALLAQQPFAGNVRELENMLHRALALSGRAHIQAADLGLLAATVPEGRAAVVSAVAHAAVGAVADMPAALPGEPPAAPAGTVPPAVATAVGTALTTATPADLPVDLVRHLDDVEREVLERALQLHRYNRTAAGASLGLSLRQMRYRMARLGIVSADGNPERGEGL